jgi:hypothetical protein
MVMLKLSMGWRRLLDLLNGGIVCGKGGVGWILYYLYKRKIIRNAMV